MTFQTLINRQTSTAAPHEMGAGVVLGGFAILHGTLAPEGCVVHPQAFSSQVFDGPARVFCAAADAILAIQSDRIRSTDILIIRHDERDADMNASDDMQLISAALEAQGLDRVTIITDGKTGRTTEGAIIGQVTPAASAGGAIAYINDDDIIHVDIAARRIDVMADIDIRRGAKALRPGAKSFGALEKYARLVASAR